MWCVCTKEYNSDKKKTQNLAICYIDRLRRQCVKWTKSDKGKYVWFHLNVESTKSNGQIKQTHKCRE